VGRPITSLVIVSFTHPSFLSPQVLAASGLVKRDLFSLPNPIAVITTDGADPRQTTVFKRTLTPYWNETFELFRTLSPLLLCHPLILPSAPSEILPKSRLKSLINANTSETTRVAWDLCPSKLGTYLILLRSATVSSSFPHLFVQFHLICMFYSHPEP
jgi:C2 domain